MKVEDILKEPIEPWLLSVAGDWQEPNTANGFVVLRLDAHKAKDLSGFYREVSSVFKLPEYFGDNLNALDECITDLEWLPAEGYVVIIENAESMLIEESSEALEGVLSVLRDAGEDWSKPVNQNEAWDREAKPFHTVLRFKNVVESDAVAKFEKMGVQSHSV